MAYIRNLPKQLAEMQKQIPFATARVLSAFAACRGGSHFIRPLSLAAIRYITSNCRVQYAATGEV